MGRVVGVVEGDGYSSVELNIINEGGGEMSERRLDGGRCLQGLFDVVGPVYLF